MIEYTVQVYNDGAKRWYLNGQYHREDGPACEYANGTKRWYLNGKLHREDGPAIEYADGTKRWWLNDILITEAKHKAAMNPVEEMTMEDICKALGKTVKVIK